MFFKQQSVRVSGRAATHPDKLETFRRGANSGFWRLTFEKTVWGDKGGIFEEKPWGKPKKNQENQRKTKKN